MFTIANFKYYVYEEADYQIMDGMTRRPDPVELQRWRDLIINSIRDIKEIIAQPDVERKEVFERFCLAGSALCCSWRRYQNFPGSNVNYLKKWMERAMQVALAGNKNKLGSTQRDKLPAITPEMWQRLLAWFMKAEQVKALEFKVLSPSMRLEW